MFVFGGSMSFLKNDVTGNNLNNAIGAGAHLGGRGNDIAFA
jgi:hypothetical protein